MTKAGWTMLAMMLIGALSSGCGGTPSMTTASGGTDAYGNNAAPGASGGIIDVYQTGRASARQNF
jgi:hypothetical protein